MPTRNMKPHECPCCGKTNDLVTGVNTKDAPSPKDISVCIGCGAISEFLSDMTLRVCTAKEVAAPEMVDARLTQRHIRDLKGLP